MMSMTCYECVFIGRQEISPGRMEALSDKINEIASESGGKVIKHENWGLRKLAYRIRKNRKGYYALIGLNVSFTTMKDIEKFLRLDEDVIRYLILRVDEIDMNPSPILSMKPGRDDRRRDRENFQGESNRDGSYSQPPAHTLSSEKADHAWNES